MNGIIKLKYPIGKFARPEIIDSEQIESWINEIELFPERIKELTEKLSDEDLRLRYRPEGWTIQQIVHHCSDSHMNSFIRFKLSITEDLPTIKPYYEDKWAEMPDYNSVNIIESIKIIEGLHSRWIVLLKSLSLDDLNREFLHPEHGKKLTLGENIGIYAWHSNHHLAHIKLALGNKMN